MNLLLKRFYWRHPNVSRYKYKDIFYKVHNKNPKICDNLLDTVNLIKSNTKVYIHGAAMTPSSLIQAMSDHVLNNNLNNIEPVHIHLSGQLPFLESKYKNHFRDNSLFIGNNARKAVNNGEADYTPIFLSEIPRLFESSGFNIDTSLVQISEPDKHGYCSLGTSVDCTRSALLSSNNIIGLMNKYVPHTHGDSHIHISHFDHIYKEDKPLYELQSGTGTDENLKIGKIIADNLIPDKACLQLGIGSIPNALLFELSDHQNLGIHTEMFSDGVLDLLEKGVITNHYKAEQCGKIVSSFCMGTQKLYNLLDNNPLFRLFDCSYVNDTHVIRCNDNVHAINSCIEIDLTGQVCSDSVGMNMYSGVGGQMDFMRGAMLSEGGKAIIALKSQTRHGVSKIVSTLQSGSGVVTTRSHVQYIVTEYGYVDLYGKTLRERAKLLISIAHPNHREELEKAAFERFGSY